MSLETVLRTAPRGFPFPGTNSMAQESSTHGASLDAFLTLASRRDALALGFAPSRLAAEAAVGILCKPISSSTTAEWRFRWPRMELVFDCDDGALGARAPGGMIYAANAAAAARVDALPHVWRPLEEGFHRP